MSSTAHWLYNQCSKACSSMGTTLSALELSLRILQIIQETDEADGDIQNRLMDALKNDGRQRDPKFVLDLCKRYCDIRDDDELSEDILKEIASSSSRGESGTTTIQSKENNFNYNINFDEMLVYQLRTRVLGLNMPTFSNLWKYLQEAGWTYSSGIYHIPKRIRPSTKAKANSSAKRAFMLMDIDHDMQEEYEEEQDEEGPEEFVSPNALVEYLDEYCMPDYRATSTEIEAKQKWLSTKSVAYQRRNLRLRWDLLEVAFRDHVKERKKDIVIDLSSKYNHNNRTCEICFKDSNRNAPKVACRYCRLVVHTKCYGVLEYDENATGDSRILRADEDGLFTCDVCSSCDGKISKRKNTKRWKASQSSGLRIHHHPEAICAICKTNNIAGGMIEIKKGEDNRRNRNGSDREFWGHLFCLNSALQYTGEPHGIRSSTDILAIVDQKLVSCAEKDVCGTCRSKGGILVKCRGQCGKSFHSLCIQIDRRNDPSYKSKDHLCLDCSNIDELNKSKEDAKTSVKRTRPNETETYFDKRANKKKSRTEGENVINIPTVNTCVAQVQKLDEAGNSSSSCHQIFNYQPLFNEWSFLLSTKQSILFYGLGSKKAVLSAFGEILSNEGDVMNINGYDKNIDLNQLFANIDQIFLDGRLSAAMDKSRREANDSLITKAVNVAKKFASMRNRPLFILINSIDGVGLRDISSQQSLQMLTQSSEKDSRNMIRIAASVDDINAAMSLWPPQVGHQFDWVSLSPLLYLFDSKCTLYSNLFATRLL